MITNSRKIGIEGEEKAWKYLVSQHFILVEKNFFTTFGEIDIIAERSRELHFIEVKYWKGMDFYSLEFSLNQKKQKRLLRTAQIFLSQFPKFFEYSIQFDLVFIDKINDNVELIEDVLTSDTHG